MAFNTGLTKRTLKFYAEDLDFFKKWYVDLPDFIEGGHGTKEDLLMVAGADYLLDLLSDNGDKIYITVSEQPFENCQQIDLLTLEELAVLEERGEELCDSGAYYYMDTIDNKFINDTLWLCDVLEYLFNGFPETIYFKVVSA